ncbi:unnamed protein product [Nippostrongylus brasiliensis]|uniref:BHLH domain-containing protein n=1 Tax=Nippostrongylus brasiliensis TaxID=27835 RepID=A0A3P7ANE9_NIPBR|nr:unnamed protein product [Nippostrongylus brasiliensis]
MARSDFLPFIKPALSATKKKIIDPFDPEASVPLPYQLDEQPYSTSVWKRNERERYRVRCVNNGYELLRRHLPVSDVEKRISKVDTLRLAIRYIKHLEAVLRDEMHAREPGPTCEYIRTTKSKSSSNDSYILGCRKINFVF